MEETGKDSLNIYWVWDSNFLKDLFSYFKLKQKSLKKINREKSPNELLYTSMQAKLLLGFYILNPRFKPAKSI